MYHWCANMKPKEEKMKVFEVVEKSMSDKKQ